MDIDICEFIYCLSTKYQFDLLLSSTYLLHYLSLGSAIDSRSTVFRSDAVICTVLGDHVLTYCCIAIDISYNTLHFISTNPVRSLISGVSLCATLSRFLDWVLAIASELNTKISWLGMTNLTGPIMTIFIFVCDCNLFLLW
jgi:hypothetical protein